VLAGLVRAGLTEVCHRNAVQSARRPRFVVRARTRRVRGISHESPSNCCQYPDR
jgi:hypothetical protein